MGEGIIFFDLEHIQLLNQIDHPGETVVAWVKIRMPVGNRLTYMGQV